MANFKQQKLVTLLATAMLAGIVLKVNSSPAKAAVIPNAIETANEDQKAAIIRDKKITDEEIADLERKRVEDESDLSNKEKELAANQNHLQEEANRLNDLKEQDKVIAENHLDEKITHQKEIIAKEAKKITNVETDLDEQKQNKGQLISGMQNMQKEGQELKKEIETKQKMINQVSDQIQANKTELVDLTRKLEEDFKLNQQDWTELINLKGQIKTLQDQISNLGQQLQDEQSKLAQDQSLLQGNQESLSQMEKQENILTDLIDEEASKEKGISSEMAYWQRQLQILDGDEIADSEKDSQKILEIKDKLASCQHNLGEIVTQRKENERKLEEQINSISKTKADIDNLLALQKASKQKLLDLVQDKDEKGQLYSQLVKEKVNLTEKLLGEFSKITPEVKRILNELHQVYEILDSNLNKQQAFAQEVQRLQDVLFAKQKTSHVLSLELGKVRTQIVQDNFLLEQAKAKEKETEKNLSNLLRQQENKKNIEQKLAEQGKKVNNLKQLQARLQSEMNQLQEALKRNLTELASKKARLLSLNNQYELLLKSEENHDQVDNSEEIKVIEDGNQNQFDPSSFLSDIPNFKQIKIVVHLGQQWKEITLSNVVKLLVNKKQHNLKVKCNFKIKAKKSRINFYRDNGKIRGVISNPDGQTSFVFCEVKLVGQQLLFRILNSKYWLSASDLDIN